MADALMKYETIDVEQIDQIMDGKVPDAPDSWSDDDNDSSTAKVFLSVIGKKTWGTQSQSYRKIELNCGPN